MANCHEADTDLTGMNMEEKPRQIVFIVHGINANDKRNPMLNHAFKSLDAAREFANKHPGSYIRECNLTYESSNKFYAGDDPL